MPLTGVLLEGQPEPPLAPAYVGLDPGVTVLTGANDSGKSTLLRHLQSQLAEGWVKRESSEADHLLNFGAGDDLWFFECTQEEADRLAWRCVSDLRWQAEHAPLPPEHHEFSAWGLEPIFDTRGEDRLGIVGSWFDENSAHEVQGLATFSDRHRMGWPSGKVWQEALALLKGSLQFAARLEGSSDRQRWRRGWHVYWCLPPRSEQPVAVRELVEGAWAARSLDMDLDCLPEGAPIPAIHMGPTAVSPLPRTITVPAEALELEQEVERAVKGVLAAVQDVLEPTWILKSELDPDAFRVAPDVNFACEYLSDAATEELPEFVRHRYRIHVTARPVSEWANGHLQIEVAEASPGEEELAFPLAALAEGFKVSAQLALFKGVDELDKLSRWISAAGEHAVAEGAPDWPVDDDELAEIAPDGDSPYWLYHVTLQLLRGGGYGGSSHGELLESELSLRGEEAEPGVITTSYARVLDTLRPRLYLLDEPERHLHPGIQRQAAQWLGEFGLGPAQVVLASHSVAFVGLAGAGIVHARRAPAGSTHFETLSREPLVATSALAMELGLDRGELLTGVRLFLFVEGAVDQAVLNALFGSELGRSGVALVPLRGASRATGVLDVSILTRFTTAQIAVWLDNVPASTLDLLTTDPVRRAQLRRDKEAPPEVRTMAEVIEEASEADALVLPIPHPGADIFDLLADESIKAVFMDWPGHDLARRAAAEAKERTGIHWKQFYADEFGVEVSPARCAEVAADMRARGAISPAFMCVARACGLPAVGLLE